MFIYIYIHRERERVREIDRCMRDMHGWMDGSIDGWMHVYIALSQVLELSIPWRNFVAELTSFTRVIIVIIIIIIIISISMNMNTVFEDLSQKHVSASSHEHQHPTPSLPHPTPRVRSINCFCKFTWTLTSHPIPPDPTPRVRSINCFCKFKWTLTYPHPIVCSSKTWDEPIYTIHTCYIQYLRLLLLSDHLAPDVSAAKKARVSLTGQSAGGAGAWRFAAEYGELWASVRALRDGFHRGYTKSWMVSSGQSIYKWMFPISGNLHMSLIWDYKRYRSTVMYICICNRFMCVCVCRVCSLFSKLACMNKFPAVGAMIGFCLAASDFGTP